MNADGYPFRCHACGDPTPRGWRHCVKCHAWTGPGPWRDDPNYYALLHPALAWLDRRRRRGDSDRVLLNKLMRRIRDLEHEMENR